MGWKRILTTTDTEFVEDTVGAMFTGNTETGIAATYQDGTNDIDLVVSDLTVDGDSGTTGMTPGDTLTIAGGSNCSTAMSGDTLTITATNTVDMGDGFIVVGDSNSNATTIIEGETLTIAGGTGITTDTSADGTLTITNSIADSNLTTEEVQDIVGAMFSGNTETRIAVTYDEGGDGTGKIDLVVDDMTANDNTMGDGFTVSATTDTTAITITEGEDLMFTAGSGITCETTGAQVVTIANAGVTGLSATANETTVSGATGAISIGLPDDVTIAGVLTVSGNLVVNGTTTTVSSTNLSVEDVCISLNTNSDGDNWVGGLSAGDSAILFAGLSASPAVDETLKLVCDFDGFQFDTGDARACLAVTHANSTTFGTSNSVTQGTLAHVKAAAYVLDDTQGTLIYDSGSGVPTDGTIVAAADSLYIYFA